MTDLATQVSQLLQALNAPAPQPRLLPGDFVVTKTWHSSLGLFAQPVQDWRVEGDWVVADRVTGQELLLIITINARRDEALLLTPRMTWGWTALDKLRPPPEPLKVDTCSSSGGPRIIAGL